MRHYLRSPEELVFATVQPVSFVLLFRFVFGGAINTSDTSYANYLMAGIFVQCMGIMALATGTGLATDLQSGLMDRLRSLPMASAAVLAGRTVAALLRSALVTSVMAAVGLLVGFRPNGKPADWLAAVSILLLFGFALSWVGVAIGSHMANVEAVQMAGMTLVMPLTFLSSAFGPTSTMPGLVRAFAENQPITQVVNAVRGPVLGAPDDVAIRLAVLCCSAVAVVLAPLSVRRFHRL